ncbi:MAG: glycosyltransferase family 2 protein [Rubripirellula sp.]|nr:glycosyltransferase family 2 protein [Rubripirellula sp.]
MLDTPVALFVFRRPDVTAQVFKAISIAKPRQLFIICDGARAHKAGEADLVSQTRDVVADVDWPCQVERRYLDDNVGCATCVSSGLDWVFSQVEHAIILEDDCVPNQSFFPFCSELLAKYESEPDVMAISGDHFYGDQTFGDGSYFFTKHFHCWGWATWRRAWKSYDHEMKGYERFARDVLPDLCVSERERRYLSSGFEDIHHGRTDSWAIRFMYAVMNAKGLCIQPNQNLVANLGDGQDGTHCSGDADARSNWMFNIPTKSLLHVAHPKEISRSIDAELSWEASFIPKRRSINLFSLSEWQRRFRKWRCSIAKRLPRKPVSAS